MCKRPRTYIKLSKFDYFFEIIGFLGILILFAFPIYFFKDLPDQIPKHYNVLGEVDSYASRGSIWVLPIIGLILYIGLSILNKFPFVFNYPVKVTDDNAERLYTIGTKTIRLLKIVIILSFAFLNYKTIAIALNQTSDIGSLYLPIFLTTLIILIGITIYNMTNREN